MARPKFVRPKALGDKRAYVPQGAVGMIVDIAGSTPSPRPKAYIATSGLATCVGVFIYARQGVVLCTHLDQLEEDNHDIERDIKAEMEKHSSKVLSERDIVNIQAGVRKGAKAKTVERAVKEVMLYFPGILRGFQMFSETASLVKCLCFVRWTSNEAATDAQVKAVVKLAESVGLSVDAQRTPFNDWSMQLSNGEVGPYIEQAGLIPENISNDPLAVQARIAVAISTFSGTSRGSLSAYRNPGLLSL